MDKHDLRKLRHESSHLAKVEAGKGGLFSGHHKRKKEIEKRLMESQIKETAGYDLSKQEVVPDDPATSPVTAPVGSSFLSSFSF